jgi:hypothetical protein
MVREMRTWYAMGMRSPLLLISCALVASVSSGTVMEAQDTASRGPNRSHTYRIRGIVTDAGREPLSEVEIAAIDSAGSPGRSTTTDERGRFDLGQFAQAALSVRARRLGYEQRTIQVQVGEAAESTALEIILLAVPEELDKVNVTAASAPTKLRGFYERSRQKRTFGRFFDQDGIRRLNPRTTSELLRSVPGVTLASNQSGGNTIRIRGCQPMVWLDDQRVPGAELDDLIVPSEIAAIEFYASSAGIPAQYLDRGNRLCGLILVWTKSG